MRDSLTIVIGGEAGQGLATVGELSARILTRAGYNFVTFQGYHSRIRGGHNTFALKITPAAIVGPEDGADLVLALNEETDRLDAPRLRPGGLMLSFGPEAKAPAGAEVRRIPFDELASAREMNIVALGVIMAALSLPLAEASAEVEELFKDKGGAEKPLAALKAGYYWAEKEIGGRYQVSPAAAGSPPRLLMTGNETLSLGAAAGGIGFCSFYPMSPATGVSQNLAAWGREAGLIVEQAEDEIAAINMAIGASYAGAGAMTATSGGGFALMGEGVSLAAMLETPILIVVVQRPGPATGLPTRTEQGDLNLVLYSGHGEFPRAILAPATAEECFTLAARGAWLAEESQGPVFILSDQYLADCTRPMKPLDFSRLPPAVNPLETHHQNLAALKPGQEYLRYDPKGPEGRSPRLLPGFSEHLVKVDSDGRAPGGQLAEDLVWRNKMLDRRLKKLDWLKNQVIDPAYYGDEEAGLVLISWGSTLGASLEARQKLASQGRRVGLLHFSQLYPLRPANWLPRLEKAAEVVCLEGNAEGQFAHLIHRESGFRPHRFIGRYDGLPLTADYIIQGLEVK